MSRGDRDSLIDRLYTLVGKTLFYGGILLTIFIVGELMRVVILVHRFNHLAGIIAFAALVVGGVYGLYRTVRMARTYPRVLHPPTVPEDLQEATRPELKRYLAYLAKTCRRFARNAALDDAQRDAAWQRAEDINGLLMLRPTASRLIQDIESTEESVMFPLFDTLSAEAELEISATQRELMNGAGLIPFPFLDAGAFISRQAKMILRMVALFHDRPAIHEQLSILRDVSRVLLSLPLAPITRLLQNNLIKQFNGDPQTVELVGRSLCAGIMVRLVGLAAAERCAAFQGWHKDEATASLLDQADSQLERVREGLVQHSLPDLLRRAPAPADGSTTRREREELVQTLVGKAVEQTRAGMPQILRPAMMEAEVEFSHTAKSRKRSRRKSDGPSGMFRLARFFGQRWKYGSRHST